MLSQSSVEVSPARQNAVVAVMCLAVVVVVANVSSLNVAVPAIGRALEADQSQLQWVVDAYALLLAALLLPAGAIGDRFSRKGTLLGGFALMALASVWSARAGSPVELIVARGAAGVGAAFVFPSTLSTITAILPDHRRSRAVAMWSGCAATGGILGIIGAGSILESHGWEWIFWGNAVLCALFVLLALVVAVDTKDPTHAHLDPFGTIASVVGVGGVVLAITEGPVRGWTDLLTVAGAAAGVLGVAVFVVWELRTRKPLLDVRLFAQPMFGAGALSIFLLFFAAFGMFFLSVQYVAYVFGYGPLDSGLALLPIGITLMPSSLFGVVLARRMTTFGVEVLGLGIASIGMLLLARLGVGNSFWDFAPALMVVGLGIGLAQGPATEAIVAALPAAKQGVASAVNDSARELGGALGIAIIGSVFNIGYRSAITDAVGIPAEIAGLVKDSPATGLQASNGSPVVIGIVRDAFIEGWRLALVVGAVIVVAGGAFIGTVALMFRLRRRAEYPPLPLGSGIDPWAPVPTPVVEPVVEPVVDPIAEHEPMVEFVVEPAVTIDAEIEPEPEPEPVAETAPAMVEATAPPTAVAAGPVSMTSEYQAAAATSDVVKAAESSLAALRLLVGEQHRTLARLDAETQRVADARHQAAAVFERAAAELQQLAAGLRDDREP